MARKLKFWQVETDPKNIEMRRRVKKLNKLIHKLNKSDKDKSILQDLLEEYEGEVK